MFCQKCGSPVEDGVKFCPNCGNPTDDKATYVQSTPTGAKNDPRDPALQDECMRSLYNHLRHEKTAWKVCGIVLTVTCALLIFIGIVMTVSGIGSAVNNEHYRCDYQLSYADSADIYAIGAVSGGVVLLIYGFLFAPVAVIDLIMIGKTQRYIDSLYKDCGEAVTRCGSVGMIVFGAFFNTIALIFIIINFVKVKSRRAVFEEVRRLQLGSN